VGIFWKRTFKTRRQKKDVRLKLDFFKKPVIRRHGRGEGHWGACVYEGDDYIVAELLKSVVVASLDKKIFVVVVVVVIPACSAAACPCC
jgi:hypothetical protein